MGLFIVVNLKLRQDLAHFFFFFFFFFFFLFLEARTAYPLTNKQASHKYNCFTPRNDSFITGLSPRVIFLLSLPRRVLCCSSFFIYASVVSFLILYSILSFFWCLGTAVPREALPGVMGNREIMSFISGKHGNTSLKMKETGEQM